MIHIAIYFSDFMAIQKLICLKIHHGESLSIPLQLNFQNEKWSANGYPPPHFPQCVIHFLSFRVKMMNVEP